MITAKLSNELEELRDSIEPAGQWPTRQLSLLAEAGVFGWLIPRRWGGSELDDVAVLNGYLELSDACLTSAFILTQFNAAVQKLVACDQDALKDLWLPRLARGECFTTVGFSHLTTSRSRGPGPAVVAEPTVEGYRLTGRIPWVTGANSAQLIVVGATTPNGDQILAAVDATDPAVKVASTLPFLALTASQTGPIELCSAMVPPNRIIAGPTPEVLKIGGRTGTGAITTSALALGLARTAMRGLQAELSETPKLQSVVSQFAEEGSLLEHKLLAAGDGVANAWSSEQIRQRANSYVTRLAQCYLAAAKGTGFVNGHPAERAVREAMFFYVWSCPQAVVHGQMSELATR